MSEPVYPMRMSPNGAVVAVRCGTPSKHAPWKVSNGGYYSDAQVSHWLPLTVDTRPIEAGDNVIFVGASPSEPRTYEVARVTDGMAWVYPLDEAPDASGDPRWSGLAALMRVPSSATE